MNMMHLWTIKDWIKVLDYDCVKYRKGLRLRFDNNVDQSVHDICITFAKWLRTQYCFPIRIPVYIKAATCVKTQRGEESTGIFFAPDKYDVEPYIRIAAGDYCDMVSKWGEDEAVTQILGTIAHELTHYFQWINGLNLTPLGEERQATRYARLIVEEYFCFINKIV